MYRDGCDWCYELVFVSCLSVVWMISLYSNWRVKQDDFTAEGVCADSFTIDASICESQYWQNCLSCLVHRTSFSSETGSPFKTVCHWLLSTEEKPVSL